MHRLESSLHNGQCKHGKHNENPRGQHCEPEITGECIDENVSEGTWRWLNEEAPQAESILELKLIYRRCSCKSYWLRNQSEIEIVGLISGKYETS